MYCIKHQTVVRIWKRTACCCLTQLPFFKELCYHPRINCLLQHAHSDLEEATSKKIKNKWHLHLYTPLKLMLDDSTSRAQCADNHTHTCVSYKVFTLSSVPLFQLAISPRALQQSVPLVLCQSICVCEKTGAEGACIIDYHGECKPVGTWM